ncbi:MAG TPA: GNAT family N-acetyltransferase [Longimicrobiaceae bacterium]|nr:GNAT family N-acetyltransferase [Longimicrobiaceae bacterium]
MEVKNQPENHRFVVDTEDGQATLDYARRGAQVLELTHTFVPEGARGDGVGDALVRNAFEYARRNGLRIRPTCPYVKSWLGDHPEEQELVAEG